ncbi:MAG: hypothetical protein IT384_29220 [Deltaproteobacteria bacterium]|nr:hypothetical protein [Deltaproteobacteria bacterium]
MAAKKRPLGRPRRANNAFGKWLDKNGVDRDQAAKKLKVARQHIDALCRGDRAAGLELALWIEAWTEGEVPARYWLSVKPPSRAGEFKMSRSRSRTRSK